MEIFTLDFWKGLWDDSTQYLDELPVRTLKGFLEGVLEVLNTMEPPDFMGTSISDQLGPVMEFIGYFLTMAGVPAAIGMIGSAVMFRLGRKVMTLGRW